MSVNCEKFLENESKSPVKLLLYKLNDRILCRKSIEFDILPKKLLLAKLRMTRLSNWNRQSGSFPDSMLFERSIYINQSLREHTKEMDPENLFLERFRDIAFETSGGIGPLKWFELTSIPGPEISNLKDKSGSLPLIWLFERFKSIR